MPDNETGLTLFEIAKRLLNREFYVYYELFDGDQYSFENLALEELTDEEEFENGFADESYFDTDDGLLKLHNIRLQENAITPDTSLFTLYIGETAAGRQLITYESDEAENHIVLLHGGIIAETLEKYNVKLTQLSWQGTTAHSSQGYKYRDTIIIISSEIVYGHHQAGLACIAKTREEALKSLEDLMQNFDVKAKSSICRYKRFFELQHFSSWQSSEEYRNMALVRLKELSKGYSTGDFEAVFPYLDNACIFSSQWVFESLNGKERIIDYLRGKGETLRNHHTCPKVVLAEEKGFGRFCLFMTQGKENDGALLFIELNKKFLITQISLCVPGFYDFQRYENDEKGD